MNHLKLGSESLEQASCIFTVFAQVGHWPQSGIVSKFSSNFLQLPSNAVLIPQYNIQYDLILFVKLDGPAQVLEDPDCVLGPGSEQPR